MLEKIKEAIEFLDSIPEDARIKVISHFDTDGITSAAIFSRMLERMGRKFSLEIIKNLESSFIENLSDKNPIVFLDLASSSLPYLAKKEAKILILDHHEIPEKEIPKNITLVNPQLHGKENIASSGICYLLARTISQQNKDLANLAVVGMIGDMMEKNLSKDYGEILKDAEVTIKKGLLLYPATRPIDRVLENSSSSYIPGVTGSFKGVLELLREAGIEKTPRGFKSLAELTEDEMSRLGTSIMLRKSSKSDTSEIIGNIYLVKFFNTLEDARQLSAMINACARLDYPEVSLGLCLGNKEMKKEADRTYTKYRKTISAALEQVQSLEAISGNKYTIINAQDKIKDTIIGTVASIMSFSPIYEEGTVIVTMAYNQDKIKVSARLAGRKGRNVREILHKATYSLSEEIGGHKNAAGCLVPKDKETQFLESLKNTLEIELIKPN